MLLPLILEPTRRLKKWTDPSQLLERLSSLLSYGSYRLKTSIITLTKQHTKPSLEPVPPEGGAGALCIVTKEMLDAGAQAIESAFEFLGPPGVDPSILAERVFRAMEAQNRRRE